MRRIIATALALLLACSASATGLFDIVTKGSVDRSVTVDIIDSTDGTPETGVVYNTAGIDLWYRREGGALVSITEATLASLTTAHADGGFLHIANGTYRLDLPDAAFATGANYVDFGGTVTGMIVIGGRVRLIDANLEVANLAANVTQFGGSAGTFASGRPEVNTSHIAGSAVSTSSAQIGVNVVNAGGTAWGSGAITAASIATDAIGAAELATDAGTEIGTATWATTTRQLTSTQTFNLTGSITGNLSGSVGSVTGAVGSVTGNVGGNVTGSVGSVASGGISEASFATTAGSFRPMGIARQGTAQSATGTTIVLDAAASFGDDTPIGMTLLACGSTQGYCQARTVTDFVGSTDTATVDTWTVTPSGTITYYLFGTAPSSGGGGGLDAAGVRSAIGLASANLDTQLSGIQSDTDNLQTRVPTSLVSGRMDASVGAYQTGLTPLQPTTAGRTLDVSTTGEAGIDWANVGSPTTTVNLSGTTISTGQAVASVSGAVGSVTGNVGGNVTGSVGSVATGGITAASIATDAIGAAEIASDAGTELATATWASGTRTLTASSDPSAASIADAVWDEARTGHTTSGTFGFYLDSAVSGVSTGGVSAGDIADAVWDEALSGHATGGSAGAGLTAASGTLSASAVRSAIGLATANLDTQLSGIQSDTNDLQTQIGTAGAGLTAADDAVMTRLGAPAGASVSADVAAVKSDSAAILVDTAEIGVAGAGLTAVDDAVMTRLGAPVGASLSADVAALVNAIRDAISEDQGNVTRGCIEAVLLAYAAGDITTTGSTTTYRDPSNGEVRITGTVTSNGNRTASITCPSY